MFEFLLFLPSFYFILNYLIFVQLIALKLPEHGVKNISIAFNAL